MEQEESWLITAVALAKNRCSIKQLNVDRVYRHSLKLGRVGAYFTHSHYYDKRPTGSVPPNMHCSVLLRGSFGAVKHRVGEEIRIHEPAGLVL